MSWELPSNYESIAPYFLPTSWTHQDLQDIATSCHIWDNCKNEFKIRPFVLNNLRESRNTYVAHNPRLKVSDLEKAKVFDALKDLFKDPDVTPQIDVQECLAELDKIQKGDVLLNSLQCIFQNLSENSENQTQLQNTVDIVMRSQDELQNSVEAIYERHTSDIEERVIEVIDTQNELIRNVQTFHNLVIRTLMKQQKDRKERNIRDITKAVFPLFMLSIIVVILAVFVYKDDQRKTINMDQSRIYKGNFTIYLTTILI